ncbi:GDSL-type esterase/lipase family protein [Jiangella gansuensis]|uniref:GDSL-type esterase/lipase family protein n=1 Tax=Jiangella gansuensis TaxID=281473 RepID=UPI001B7F9BD2|nr:GDSL-type esterase/lipase family protein [Jiangella gansuensis]
MAWTVHDSGWQPWRLPPEEQPLAYAPSLYKSAAAAAGVRFGASIQARAIEIEIIGTGDEVGPIDVLVDGRLAARQPPGPDGLRIELPSQQVRVEVWLPHRGSVAFRSIRAAEVTSIAPLAATKRWVAYGSSITQCAASNGPSQTWPALVSRALGWKLTCMGFSGECQLDPVVSRAIAHLAPEIVTLCLGINVYRHNSFSVRSWRGQVAELIRRIREARETTAIVVGSPIFCPAHEATPNDAGMTLADYREHLHQVAHDFRDRGDHRVHVLDGRLLLGPDDAHLLHDGVHPNHDGYRLMAGRMAQYLETTGIADVGPLGTSAAGL